jgi:hypothetical protein
MDTMRVVQVAYLRVFRADPIVLFTVLHWLGLGIR